jgi:hypothetical protein
MIFTSLRIEHWFMPANSRRFEVDAVSADVQNPGEG